MLDWIRTGIANHIWILSSFLTFRRFIHNCRDPQKAQLRILKKILVRNASSQYGLNYEFSSISDYPEFARKVPIIDYSDIENLIEATAGGEKDVLTCESILRFEETSGSSGFARLIPYTAGLIRQFNEGIGPWIHALWKNHPGALRGRSYWSLSPATKERRMSGGGIPIGSADDTEYFSWFTRWILGGIMAIAPDTARIKDPDQFYEETLLQLLGRRNLSLISVWSPSFFLKLDERLRVNYRELLKKLSSSISSSRLQHLASMDEETLTWKDIWPKLWLCSCWTHASAAGFIPELRNRLGEIPVQGKGLISTEGIVSIPIAGSESPVAAIQSHFLEGMDLETERILPVYDWKLDRRYEVLLTTAGGLYRYRTGDVVQVTDFYRSTPCLRFLGRSNRSSDLTGEKLSEYQAIRMIQELHLQGFSGKFLLFPRPHINGAGYILLVEPLNEHNATEWRYRLKNIVDIAEGELRKNPYYHQARSLDQLDRIHVQILTGGSYEKIMSSFQKKKGTSGGDFKNPVLLRDSEIRYEELELYFIPED